MTSAPSPSASPNVAAAAGTANPIAQKMMDALDKYEQLKKQEDQQHSSDPNDPPKVDLSL